MNPTFTILLPVVRTPELMRFAIDSVLAQSRGDFELCVIGDGAPAESIAAAEEASKRDNRVRVFPFPKGQRHGEAHRHTVLQRAQGRYVCQIADDDQWFPEHLEEMAALLAEFEFGNLLHITVTADNTPWIELTDLASFAVRERMLGKEMYNIFGPTSVGYRMETYRRLPVGWSPALETVPTDLTMWRKFLALPGLIAGTRYVTTSVHFPTVWRRDWPLERRREESARYAGLIASAAGRDSLRREGLRAGERRRQSEIDDYRSSLSWRVTGPLRYVGGLFLRK